MKTPRLLAILFFTVAIAARASLTIALVAGPQVAEQGAELIFIGTLTNTSGTDKLFLNDLDATLTGISASHLSLKTNAFFANVPGVLLPGETYTGVLFRIAVSRVAPPDSYGGMIAVLGGANTFATTSLASADFTIVSPVAGIVATDPIACEFGPENGAFTVARTGSTAFALTIPMATSGTATSGTTYSVVGSSITIPVGAVSASIPIVPIPDSIAQGDRMAIITLGNGSGYNLGANSAATVVVRDKPIDEWRFDKFAAAAVNAAAGDLADWEGDGIRNLVEYALNLEPLTPDGTAQPTMTIESGYLTLSYIPKSWATDLTYVVEASIDLVNWSAANVESVDVEDREPPDRVTMRYKNPVNPGGRAWLRLSITRDP